MQQELEQKLNEGIANIKPFPSLVQEAISLIDSATADSRQLSNILKQDPVLAVRILSLANSPFYGMSKKIEDIETACVILGNNIIKNILVSAGALGSFPVTEERKRIWAHSIEVANVSELLAKKFNQPHEKAYIAGLLHDVGKFLLIDSFPEYQSLLEAGTSLECIRSVEEELKMIGISHAQAGAKITGIWNLSKDIQNIIEMHHNPDEADDYATCSLLSLADEICRKFEMKLTEEEFLKSINRDILALLNLEIGGLQSMIPDIKAKIDSVTGVLEQWG